MSKAYILQKDLPGGLKKGAKFIFDGSAFYDSEHVDDYGEINHYIPKCVENNPEWFLPEENKSNDSFQWDDGYVELILQAATGNIKDFVMNPKEFIHDFKENWKSKPQAENKPLFRTEDGKDIFEGDEYWFVPYTVKHLFHGRAHKLAGSGSASDSYKYFSTKEAAEKYIVDNKPQPQKEEQRTAFGKWVGYAYVDKDGNKLFTQQQVDAMCEDAFNAGRASKYNLMPFDDGQFKYPTYQDYKNSKQ